MSADVQRRFSTGGATASTSTTPTSRGKSTRRAATFCSTTAGPTRSLRLTATRETVQSPRFTPDGEAVVYGVGDNLYRHDLGSGATRQLTDLRQGEDPEKEQEKDAQDRFLEAQQEALFSTIRKQQEEDEEEEAAREADRQANDPPPTFYYGKADVRQLRLDPTGRFVTFALAEEPEGEKETSVQDYVTESGYAEELTARAKVGTPGETSRLYVQDLQRDTTYQVDLSTLPGAYDLLDFLQENREDREATADTADTSRADSSRADSSKVRSLYAFGPHWSPDGRYAVLDVRARDNKDRWIALLDAATAELTVLDRQHDDAWIGGPGLSWWGGAQHDGLAARRTPAVFPERRDWLQPPLHRGRRKRGRPAAHQRRLRGV